MPLTIAEAFHYGREPAVAGRSVESKKNKALRHNMEQVLIERFFEAVKSYLAKDRNIEDNEKRFHFGGIKEIPGIIRTGKSSTWD